MNYSRLYKHLVHDKDNIFEKITYKGEVFFCDEFYRLGNPCHFEQVVTLALVSFTHPLKIKFASSNDLKKSRK